MNLIKNTSKKFFYKIIESLDVVDGGKIKLLLVRNSNVVDCQC